MKAQFTLVTGASGFIGGQIARLLAEKGYRLKLLLRPEAKTGHLAGIPFTPAYGDLRDSPSLKRAMEGVGTVYHVAALFALWAKRRADFHDINVQGTRNMCRAALKAGVKKFVYTSTTGAIGISDDPERPCTEATAWNRGWTNDPYTLSKYEAEQAVLQSVQQGLPAVILNPTGPIGPGDVHPTPTGKMIRDFINGRIPFYIDAHFSLVDVRDAALGHWLAETRGKIGERYILSGENLSARDLFARLARFSGKKAPGLKIPTPVIQQFAKVAEWAADRVTGKPPLITKAYAALLPYYFWFDAGKSRRELGLKYRPIDEAIRDAVAWFRNDPSAPLN